MDALISPITRPPLQLAVSRDVRARKLDDDWLLHFRADAPANAGFRMSDGAFAWLAQFGGGAPLRSATAPQLTIVGELVHAGVLIGDRYDLRGQETHLPLTELVSLRGAVRTEHTGVLELESALLYLLARANERPGPIVELGSMYGGSTISLARGALGSTHHNRVIAIDDHEWHRHLARAPDERAVSAAPNTLDTFRENIARAGVESTVELVIGDTAVAAGGSAEHVSLLFVDADHSLVGVRRDLAAWLPRLESGSIVAFHDYANDMWPDVRRAVDERRSLFAAFSVWQTLAIAAIA